tara:strand:+ start:432 stop:779 length:348 start_codon:yes stop_codon:yes gene_type:complete
MSRGDEYLWQMRDGRSIYIQEMETSHIVNTMRMLERAAKSKAFRMEISYDVAFSDKDWYSPTDFEGDPNSHLDHRYSLMYEELKGRGFKLQRAVWIKDDYGENSNGRDGHWPDIY